MYFIFVWFTDIDECGSNPCVNGQCQDGINQYQCMCDPGWTGVNCDVGTYFIVIPQYFGNIHMPFPWLNEMLL